ncbi:MAG TPA: NAD(P)-dependent oxidoreductase [Pyrinomonadaceae bacterium]|nr:NAD(P)-dependent oxidoreductase [Pyrinomonadaceae bacterium]
MKVFVAGATGALGLPLVRALVARKHQVTGLTRSAEKRRTLEQLGAATAIADALDAAGLEQAVRAASPDCVFHLLTAIPKNTLLRASHMKQTNVLRTTGTANLLKASVATGVKRIVAESMVFAYGFGDHGAAAKTEGDVLRQREPESSLQETVDALRSLEVQLLTANEQRLIESVVLRYGFFYGSGPSTEYIVKMLRRRMLPKAKGARGVVPWIHIDDAVNASLAAMERGHAGEIYNIVDDEPVGMNEWLTHAALSLKAKPPFSIPLWLLRLMSPYLATVFDTRLAVSNRKAKDELDWRLQYPNYREGLREVAAHL